MSHINKRGKYRQTKLERDVARTIAAAEATLDKLASTYRTAYVVPFCDRTGYRFYAGMGHWGFMHPTDESKGIEDFDWKASKLPRLIGESLSVTHLRDCQDMGSTMLDYTPKNYKGPR